MTKNILIIVVLTISIYSYIEITTLNETIHKQNMEITYLKAK